MSPRTLFAAAALALAALAAPATAAKDDGPPPVRPVEEKNLLSGKQKLDPTRGYIYILAPYRQFGLFLKQPDAEEVAEYEAEWREEFDEAREDFPKKYARWERDYETLKNTRRPPVKPIEPTEANFSIGPLATRHLAGFGPQFVYAKGEGWFAYLMEVDPAVYTYYGPALVGAGVYGGKCFCMGSVKFEVKPGVITNLGNFLTLRWQNQEQLRLAFPLEQQLEALNEPVDYFVPESLTGLPVERAVLRAAGKMNNYFGIPIGRMPPVPGVLAYERDTVIDVVAQREAEEKAAAEAEAARVAAERAAAERAAAEAAAAEVAAAAAAETEQPAAE